MFIKQGKDFIYLCRQCQINKEDEINLVSNKYIEIWQNISPDTPKDRATNYYRIVLLKKPSLKVMPYTLLITIPKTKFKHCVLVNGTTTNFVAVQYSFGNTGYISIGKLCTEKNI